MVDAPPSPFPADAASPARGSEPGRLFLADNLDVLGRHLADDLVDLIYLDPPFNSRASYGGSGGAGFDDVWRWDDAAAETLAAGREAGGSLARALTALEIFPGPSPLLAYLVMMAPRLAALHRVLRPTGSIYLHCDGSACHYLKVLMDAVFGPEQFLNHIVWLYGLGGSSPRHWPRKHDDLLWYARCRGRHHFEAAQVPARSQRMKGQSKKAPDYWDIPALNNMARERSGYPTQKPEALLERIVASSSRPGDLVLDPFCGSGTTLVVAEALGRRWIGIDSAPEAMKIARGRLEERSGRAPEVIAIGS